MFRSLFKRPLLLVGSCVLLLTACVQGASVQVASPNLTIDGSWSCNNRGDVKAIVGARVELWQQGLSTPTKTYTRIGVSVHTDSSGSYSFGPISSSSPFNYRVVLVYNDDHGVHLEDQPQKHDPGTTVTGNTASGNLHHDVIINKGGGKGSPECAIWQGAHNAYQEYVSTVKQQPPARNYTIQMSNDFPNIQLSNIFPTSITFGTPFTTLDTTYWPYNFATQESGSHGPYIPYEVNFHEFGHSVRHSLDGDFGHFLIDVARFGYARNHDYCSKTNEGYAFNEGWAEFWANNWGATPPNAPNCSPLSTTDMTVEGNVAAALYNLSLCPSVGRAGMVKVLQQNKGKIHSFTEFRDALTHIFHCAESD